MAERIPIAEQVEAVQSLVDQGHGGEALVAAHRTLAWIERRPAIVRTIDEMLQTWPEGKIVIRDTK